MNLLADLVEKTTMSPNSYFIDLHYHISMHTV
jgi:hypothetical protein